MTFVNFSNKARDEFKNLFDENENLKYEFAFISAGNMVMPIDKSVTGKNAMVEFLKGVRFTNPESKNIYLDFDSVKIDPEFNIPFLKLKIKYPA